MALKIYDTLAPQGDYPAVNAADVEMPDGSRLDAFGRYGDTNDGKLLFVLGGVAVPLTLGPGLYIENGVLYISGSGTTPEEPDVPVEGVEVTLVDDGTILLSCNAELDESGVIVLPVQLGLTEDGTILIGGDGL